jgi:hypothetical protein
LSSPRGLVTTPSFYRPRGGGLQSCRTILITCSGMVYNPWNRRLSWQIPLLAERHGVQERLRGWRCGSSFPGRRPYADSRVQLTVSRRVHNSRRGGVLSSRTPTTSGMALRCPIWRRGGGDGRTGPMVTEETRLTGPTSRHRPGRARDGRPYPFRGLRRPL